MIYWTQPKEHYAYGLKIDPEGNTKLVLIGRSYNEPTIHHIARRHAFSIKKNPLWLPKCRTFVNGRQVLAKIISA